MVPMVVVVGESVVEDNKAVGRNVEDKIVGGDVEDEVLGTLVVPIVVVVESVVEDNEVVGSVVVSRVMLAGASVEVVTILSVVDSSGMLKVIVVESPVDDTTSSVVVGVFVGVPTSSVVVKVYVDVPPSSVVDSLVEVAVTSSVVVKVYVDVPPSSVVISLVEVAATSSIVVPVGLLRVAVVVVSSMRVTTSSVVIPFVGVVLTSSVVKLDVEDVVVASQAPGRIIWLLISVTAPFNAKTPPVTDAPSCRLIEVNAKILPLKAVVVRSVADEPTCQNTLHARAPLMSCTVDPVAAVRLDPIWNTKSALGSFSPSSVSVPVIPTAAGAV